MLPSANTTIISFLYFVQRIACYIQVFAFSRWLAVTLPAEYYEFTRGIQWSVPYLCLPWERDHSQPMVFSPNTSISSHFFKNGFSSIAQTVQFEKGNLNKAGVVYGAPLTAMEYRSFFEVCTVYVSSKSIRPFFAIILDTYFSTTPPEPEYYPRSRIHNKF